MPCIPPSLASPQSSLLGTPPGKVGLKQKRVKSRGWEEDEANLGNTNILKASIKETPRLTIIGFVLYNLKYLGHGYVLTCCMRHTLTSPVHHRVQCAP